MSWKLPIYQHVALSEFFQQTLSPLAPASVCLSGIDGKSLWVEAQAPADAASLPAMMQTCNQFFNFKDGELGLCNDPYTGGTDLSHITVMVGVGALAATKADFILGIRFALEPHWTDTGKLSDEGVRIPPTPIGTLRSPNWDLLAMIGSQPQIPRGFDGALRAILEKMSTVHASLERALNERNGIFNKACGKDFLAASTRAFHKTLGHLALGESFASTRLSTGELVKLRMKVEDEKILFDFSGTDSSNGVHLTELMTFSTCYRAIQETLDHKLICNSGAFDSIVVSAPVKTLLNAKAPAGTWRGAHEGVGELLAFLTAHLRKLNKIQAPPPVATHAGFVDLRFEGSVGGFFYLLPNGTDADFAFSTATNTWRLSAEQIEAQFPVLVKQLGERNDSGEGGKRRGGNRHALTFQALAPAQARWNFAASSGDPALASLHSTVEINAKPQELRGQTSLATEHAFAAASAAGRGAGEVKTEEENS